MIKLSPHLELLHNSVCQVSELKTQPSCAAAGFKLPPKFSLRENHSLRWYCDHLRWRRLHENIQQRYSVNLAKEGKTVRSVLSPSDLASWGELFTRGVQKQLFHLRYETDIKGLSTGRYPYPSDPAQITHVTFMTDLCSWNARKGLVKWNDDDKAIVN